MGRGRLSNIELLPEECAHVVHWAALELQKRERPQMEIFAEFTEKLKAIKAEDGELDFLIPSRAAFNRYSIKGLSSEATQEIMDQFLGVKK